LPRRPAPTSGFGLLLPFLLVIVTVSSVFLPLFPSITGTFSIQTLSSGSVQVSLLTASYTKQTVIGTIGSTFNAITFPIQQVQTGNYVLNIGISYSNTVLSNSTLSNVGDGTYVFKVVFNWRVETSGSPYVVIVTVSMNNQVIGSLSFNVLPS
jgi:hypothetical protein